MAMELDNQELKAIQNDENLREQFLEQLIHEYSQSVLWLAYTYVKEKQLAEEVTQDVFMTCYNKISSFKNQSSIKTWMYRITVNKCKDELRKKSFKRFLLRNEQSQDNWGAYENHPESILVQEMEDEVLTNNVMSLPTKFREVIYMHYFEDMKIREISEIFNVKLNTIKTRLNRGRSMLRKMYEDKEGLK
ncbi:sigma-70 family RNA polymerase sigma factor [Virgibacillus doumboii]|uniref:sigma-70 family RNA polymerase sigma factor n=1 Tax=Virgibacillus doumboii TaxID=2697503 RepID=UPI0013DEC9F6|nr:sigma-70 family RNA polymerase sigma factor [Virgibacillus doumboii]